MNVRVPRVCMETVLTASIITRVIVKRDTAATTVKQVRVVEEGQGHLHGKVIIVCIVITCIISQSDYLPLHLKVSEITI